MTKINIGIDLGTSTTCSYYYANGSYKEVVQSDGSNLSASVIGFSSVNPETAVIGNLAKQNKENFNGAYVYGSKRLIGQSTIPRFLRNSSVEVKEINSKLVYNVVCKDGSTGQFSPMDIQRKLIENQIKIIKERLNCEIGSCVITVPSNFHHCKEVV